MLHSERSDPYSTTRGIIKRKIARIPKFYILHLGRAVGTCLYYFDKSHQRIVRRNIQFSLALSSPKQITRVSKRIFQHFGISLVELLQMTCFTQQELASHVRIEGKEFLTAALAKQKGIVFVTAHLGNYEMAAQSFPCVLGLPLTSIAKKMRNVRLNRLIHNTRTRFGNQIIYKKGALPEMMQTLRRGGMITILMDVSRRFDGVEVNFFGRRATATPSAALLGLRCKSPILPAFSYRDPKGQLITQVEPPVKIERSTDLRVDLQTNTQRITDRIERAVRRHPEQWNWMLKRWKEFYPDLYPESKKRLQMIADKKRRKNPKISKPSKKKKPKAKGKPFKKAFSNAYRWVCRK
jgi:KDO2-lipid IV(A) lauroyltransferase